MFEHFDEEKLTEEKSNRWAALESFSKLGEAPGNAIRHGIAILNHICSFLTDEIIMIPEPL